MRYCKEMKRVITALVAKHGIDVQGLDQSGEIEDEYRRLKLELYEEFVFTIQAGSPLSAVFVGYYFEQNGDQVPDPEPTFARTPEGWVPLTMQMMMGRTLVGAQLGDNGPVVRDAKFMDEIADYAEEFADQIEARYLKCDEATVVV